MPYYADGFTDHPFSQLVNYFFRQKMFVFSLLVPCNYLGTRDPYRNKTQSLLEFNGGDNIIVSMCLYVKRSLAKVEKGLESTLSLSLFLTHTHTLLSNLR